MNDSQVNQVNLGEVLNQKAYVLFYIRIPSPDNNSNKFLPQMVSPPSGIVCQIFTICIL